VFTPEQINEIHDRLGKASTLRAYLQALREIGVERSDSFVTDGHTDHHGLGQVVSTPPAHETFPVADTCHRAAALEALKEPDYFKMSEALAASGVEKWTFDNSELTITYYDRSGKEILSELIA
jgi:uncharacterized protein YbcV (DUF1398 family)